MNSLTEITKSGIYIVRSRSSGHLLFMEVADLSGKLGGKIYETWHPLSYLDQYYVPYIEETKEPENQDGQSNTSDIVHDGQEQSSLPEGSSGGSDEQR